MRIETQILQRLPGAGDKSAERAEGFRESSVSQADAILDSKLFRRAATVLAAGEDGMRFIDEDARPVRLRDRDQVLEMAEIAVHRINALDDDELAPAHVSGLTTRVERRGIVMLEFLGAAARENGAIAQTQVRTIVEHGDVGFAEQSGDGAERAAEIRC